VSRHNRTVPVNQSGGTTSQSLGRFGPEFGRYLFRKNIFISAFEWTEKKDGGSVSNYYPRESISQSAYF
jgi:hypothetical protein